MTTTIHYTEIDEYDLWFPWRDVVTHTMPDWRAGDTYNEFDIVRYCGLAYISKINANSACPSWPGDPSKTGWELLNLVALPWRKSTVYVDGALIYSTASGAVWIYDEPSEEWCLLLTLSEEHRVELRAQRMGKEVRHG